ncbi:MAG: transglycosylase SLT domain-containing protein [Prevotellaceae bacterium]|jgi:membrane-bound lytic murein transglycosylase MltF|nr:transglycosylase SLT domain-containing protein [Prevotellaceae bacterium]
MRTCRKYFFLWVLIPFLAVLFILLGSGTGHGGQYHAQYLWEKDTLVCVMGNNFYDYYLSKAEPVGFQLEIIRAFAKACQCPYRIDVLPSFEQRRQALAGQQAGIMICSREEFKNYMQDDRQTACFLLPDSSAWVMDAEHTEMIKSLGQWLAQFRQSKAFKAHRKKYYTVTLTNKERPPYSSLSPYDTLIKKYAKKIHWDWRLLASLICQESRFNSESQSRRGAYGLMQLMPQTAEGFGIFDIENPESNLQAGVKYLHYVTKYLHLDETTSETDRLKFTLAAYNAGIGRMRDCRVFAESQGKNPDKWDEVASVIPLMRHETYYAGDAIQLGYFKGSETLAYVRNVWERYEHYLNLVAL